MSRIFMVLLMILLVDTPLYSRGHRVWSQQELYDESTLVAIVTSAEPKRVENTDEFRTDRLEQYESTLTVQAIFKGEERPNRIK